MAASPNRSPSPTITGRRNPISRMQETSNSIRKSFGGFPVSKPSISAPRSFNPITPANTPSDFAHRNLGVKEGIRASYEQKENERDQSSLNYIKAKSPVISKGAKSFMAPTISAASKFTPSPRKKVLAERNEPARPSLSIPDATSPLPRFEIEEIRLKSEVGLDSQVVPDTPKVTQVFPKPKIVDFHSKEDLGSSSFPVLTSLESSKTEKIGSKPVMGVDNLPVSDSPQIPEISSKPRTNDTNTKEDSSLDLSKSEKIGSKSVLGLGSQQFSDASNAPETHNPSLPVSTSPDIDPSLAPYDPRTNYLSPRPRFLRYKPNPRIEIYKENTGGKDLEDSVTSESSPESEPTEGTLSPDGEIDSADSFSSELKAETATDSVVSEPELEECDAHDNNLKAEESSSAKEIPLKRSHSCSSARPKFISFLLVLAVFFVSMSATDSPIIPSSSGMFKDHLLTHAYVPELRVLADHYLRDFAEIAMFASANLERASDNLRQWSLNSLSRLAGMISIPRGGGLGVISFMNLTALDTDISVNKLLADKNQIKTIGVTDEEKSDRQEVEVEKETQVELEEEQHHYSEAYETEPVEVVHEEPKKQTSHDPMTEEEIMGAEERKEKDESNSHAGIVEAKETKEKGLVAVADIMEAGGIEEKSNLNTQADIVEADETREKGGSNSVADIMDADGIEEKVDLNTQADAVEAGEIEEADSSFHADLEPTNVEISAQNSHSVPGHETRPGLDAINMTIRELADDFTIRIALGISSILLTIAVAAASLYLKKIKVTTQPEVELLKQPVSTKKLTSHSVSASNNSHSYTDRSLFYKPTEVETVGESGPLEVSSSLEDSLSTSQRSSDRMETKSHERRNSNRDSMVSTSEYSAGSPSYGSFTTYEKLHKGSGEDNTMTPVRRSSRLRKQVTSP